MTTALHLLTTEHAHLLRAAFCPSDEALGHWQAWRTSHNLHAASPTSESVKRAFTLLDTNARQLLPMIYRNLEGSGDTLLGFLQQAYETTLDENRRLLVLMDGVLDTLWRSNVKSMVLGELPLATMHYGDVGVRSINELSLLVPKDQVDMALGTLRQQQWLPSDYELQHRRQLASLLLTRPDGVRLRLHWYALPQHTYPGADEPFWTAAHTIDLPTGMPTLTLSPTYLLFQTLVVGYQGGQRTAVASLPDCLQLIRSGQISWDELLDLTERFTFRIPVRWGLMALQTHLDLQLPPAVQQRLCRMMPTPTEQRYFDLLVAMPRNALSQQVQRLRCSQLALRLFHRNGSLGSIPGLLWRHLDPRLAWPNSAWAH